jgi:hypothetical protein
MPVYEFVCESCGGVTLDLAPAGTWSVRCKCGAEARRVPSLFSAKIPAWMSDDAIAVRAKHREWLNSPQAKKMDLQRCPGDDD